MTGLIIIGAIRVIVAYFSVWGFAAHLDKAEMAANTDEDMNFLKHLGIMALCGLLAWVAFFAFWF